MEKRYGKTHFRASTFDHQKALPVPKSDVGLAYYQTYNFFSELVKKFYWNDSLARRRASETPSNSASG